jgi:perosamine synthetase
MSDYIGRNFAVSITNGTAALELAIVALDIGLGDEVILPSFTIISCAQAVVKAGATRYLLIVIITVLT